MIHIGIQEHDQEDISIYFTDPTGLPGKTKWLPLLIKVLI
jgi:hypothetical protein